MIPEYSIGNRTLVFLELDKKGTSQAANSNTIQLQGFSFHAGWLATSRSGQQCQFLVQSAVVDHVSTNVLADQIIIPNCEK